MKDTPIPVTDAPVPMQAPVSTVRARKPDYDEQGDISVAVDGNGDLIKQQKAVSPPSRPVNICSNLTLFLNGQFSPSSVVRRL